MNQDPVPPWSLASHGGPSSHLATTLPRAPALPKPPYKPTWPLTASPPPLQSSLYGQMGTGMGRGGLSI